MNRRDAIKIGAGGVVGGLLAQTIEPAAATGPAGTLDGTFTDSNGRVTDLTGTVTMTAAAGTVDILGATATPRVLLWSQVYGPTVTTPMLVIDQPIVLDINATCAGLEIVPGGELIYDPNTPILLRSDAHSVCLMGGKLSMAPVAATVKHELRFLNVTEANYLPGVVDHDANVGLCVMSPGGTLELVGAPKRGWCRATGAIAAGATSFSVADASGWRVGDEIVIAPTEASTVTNHWTHYDRRVLTAVTGNTVSCAALTYPHPTNTSPSGTVIAAEVINLTRNVVISGDIEHNTVGAVNTNGRAEIMFMDDNLDLTMSHVELVHLGPRQTVPGKTYTDVVLGHYGLHFHRMGDATRGINLVGIAAHDLGSRAFVPHASHGITFTDCATWGFFDAGYWWDQADNTIDATDDLFYDHCFAGLCKRDAANSQGGLTNAGFMLAAGTNTRAEGCVTTAVTGKKNSAGYQWPATTNGADDNVWLFSGNDAHNNEWNGTFVWHNDNNVHHIVGFRSWNHGQAGVLHGAYRNSYSYESPELWGSGGDFGLKAQSTVAGDPLLSITGGYVGKVVSSEHQSQSAVPVIFRNTVMTSFVVSEANSNAGGIIDIIDCSMTPAQVTLTFIHPATVIRIQQGSQAWRVTSTGTTSIPLFA